MPLPPRQANEHERGWLERCALGAGQALGAATHAGARSIALTPRDEADQVMGTVILVAQPARAVELLAAFALLEAKWDAEDDTITATAILEPTR